MNKIIITIALLQIFTANIYAQFNDLTQPIPMDPAVRMGVLENGMTYFIRNNKRQEERASFYIFQNVGAILENEEQNGLAHFLEHMAFNGTQHFPGKSMLNTLEHHGVKFGRDINAYTSLDETVYNISNVPVSNNGLLDTCLLVLNDWSNYLLLTKEEIDAERGVIAEEWRTRRNAGFRLRAQYMPLVLNHSKYSERDVIGDLEVIKNFDPETLRAFYHDWYRTDLQAIAIVGDVDVDEVEDKVKQLFSSIPAVENPIERPTIEIEDNIEPKFIVATDKEVQSSSVSLIIRHKDNEVNTLGKWRKNYVNSVFNTMIKARLNELIQKGEASFLGGAISIGGMVRGYKAFNIRASAKEGEEEQAFKGVLVELERVIRHGFTSAELERVKTNMLVNVEMAYTKRNERSNDAICKSIKSVFLNDTSFPGSEFSYQFAKNIIPSITLEEVSNIAKVWYTKKNRTVVITGPDKEGIHLSKDETFAFFDEVSKMEIEPYTEEITGTDLMNGYQPVGGEIISEKALEQFKATEWKLSNGTTVVYRFANFEKRNVALKAYSYGGSSLYDNDDLPSIHGIRSYVNQFGIGDYDAIAYRKLMTGSTASCGFQLGSLSENLSGSCAPEDFEKMLQLLYMRFEMPRFDKNVFENLKERSFSNVKNRVLSPTTLISDTLQYIFTNGNPRVRKLDSLFLTEIDFNRLEEIYRDRFSDASDFTFFIVGDIPKEKVKPLVAKYIGSITDIDREETWLDRKIEFPEGKQEREIAVPMTDAKSTVLIKMQMDVPYSRDNMISQSILASILRLRYTEEIREKEGGTYGVNVQGGATRLPEGSLNLTIQFDCDPGKAQHLKSLIFKELELIKNTVREDDLKKVVLNMKKNSEQSKPHNRYWMGVLNAYYTTGQNALESSYFDDIVNSITTQDIANKAKQFIDNANMVSIIIYPKENI